MSVTLGGNILVTGSNRGIGLELVKQLAEKTPEDARIYAGCRTPDGSNAQVSFATLHFTQLVRLSYLSVETSACPRWTKGWGAVT